MHLKFLIGLLKWHWMRNLKDKEVIDIRKLGKILKITLLFFTLMDKKQIYLINTQKNYDNLDGIKYDPDI